MIITHGGWLAIQLNGKQFQNGEIYQVIYEDEDDFFNNTIRHHFISKTQIYLFSLLLLNIKNSLSF